MTDQDIVFFFNQNHHYLSSKRCGDIRNVLVVPQACDQRIHQALFGRAEKRSNR
jgi:hypothetical protein